MSDDEQGNAGFLLPPPLTYLSALLAGLLLDQCFRVHFLARGLARLIGWPLVVGGVLLNGWFHSTMRRADTPIDPGKPVSNLTTEGPFRYTRNPAYLSSERGRGAGPAAGGASARLSGARSLASGGSPTPQPHRGTRSL